MNGKILSFIRRDYISSHEFISKEWSKLLRIAVALYDKKLICCIHLLGLIY